MSGARPDLRTSRPTLVRVAWMSLVCVALGCTERRVEPEARSITLPMRGCVHVSRLCEVGEAPLVFFAEDATAARAEFEGEALSVRTVEYKGGLRIEVDVPARRGTLTLHITDDAPRFMRVSVGPVPTEDAPTLAAARSSTTRAIMGEGASSDAPSDRSAVRRGPSGGETQGADSADARSPRPPTDREVALTRFADARRLYREGDAIAALAALEESASAADRAALRSQASRSRMLAVWIAAKSLRDFEVARGALEKVPERSPYDGEADVLRAYHAAVLASEVGDRREALAQIAVAKAQARQLGDDAMAIKAEIAELNTLDELGRFEESARGWRALVDAGTDDGCVHQMATSNLGWSLMRASRGTEEAGAWLDRALDDFGTRCTTPPPTRRANLLVNIALLHLERGSIERAQAALDAGRGISMLPEHAQWFGVIEGRVKLARAEPERAEAIFSQLAELADAQRLTEVAWHAWVGLGRSREALGRLDAAASAYSEAEKRTAREALLVPVDGGRQHLYGDRDESARRWIALELARGKPDAAFEVLRRVRRRTLEAIEFARRVHTFDGASRERWERDVARYRKTRDALEEKSAALSLLPKSQRSKQALELERTLVEARLALDRAIGDLAAAGARPVASNSEESPRDFAAVFRSPMPGEVLIAWYPLIEGWALFAGRTERVVAKVIGPEPEPAVLVSGLRDELESAERITVLAPGGSDRFSLHRAELDGTPLGRTKLVTYSLDLPPRPRSRLPNRTALVVSDPRSDLRAARVEGARVADNLETQGWAVSHLSFDDATRARFFAGLGRSGLLHYAGHGTFAGDEGWESSLLLADGRVTVGDVLTSTSALDAVLLVGCRTAESSGLGASSGLGIAQAFVLGGARAVLAATREIDDVAAAIVSAQISSRLRDGSDLLATYQRSVHGTDAPLPEWDAFVLLTP